MITARLGIYERGIPMPRKQFSTNRSDSYCSHFILLVQCLLLASIYLHLLLEVNITKHQSLAIDHFRYIKIQHGSEA